MASCGERAAYRVVVHVPGGTVRAARIELAVLDSCDDVASAGDDPLSPVRVVDGHDGAEIGAIEPGSYGLYARAWEADCTLYAAGCAPFAAKAEGQGTIEVVLTEIAPRGCPAGEACADARCVGPNDDGGVPDGGLQWLLVDDADEDFSQGDPGESTIVSGSAVRLREGEGIGTFDSRELVAPIPDARGLTLFWLPSAPYGKGLPASSALDDEQRAYAEGGADVTGLVLLLHMNGSAGLALENGALVDDSSGRRHDAVAVDLGDPADSAYRLGRIGGSVFIHYDDYLRVPDALTEEDFHFGTDDFTWAAWVRIEGCEPSEDNVIALGGEIPHNWLGAMCPEGVALFEVHDDTGTGDGLPSPNGVVDGVWHHLVGVKAASPAPRTYLYVDGVLVASREQAYGEFSNFTKDLLIGNFPIGTPPTYQYRSELEVDEIAIFKRALSADEVHGLYRRGALRLKLQVRACPAGGCGAEPFVGPDGNEGAFYSDQRNEEAGLPPAFTLPEGLLGGSFQYRAVLESDEPEASPALDRVEIVVAAP